MSVIELAQEQCFIEDMAQTENLFRQAGERFQNHADRIKELATRLRDEQLNLAVLGQFKRGKSSLINALLCGELLPTSTIPLTALPTVIRWGKKRRVLITFENGRIEEREFENDKMLSAFLSQYVAEEQNPRNHYDVKQVEVKYPAEFLAGGVTLIDTPGVGSTFKHNTETSIQFLDQCDAALFVISADPPITESEIEFLQAVKGHIRRLFFVLNKIDYLNVNERETVIAFLRTVLKEQGDITEAIKVYGLSARQALVAKQVGDACLLEHSGLTVLEKDLLEFYHKEKKTVLVAAIRTKFTAVLREASLELELCIKALELPVAELESKKHRLLEKLAAIEEERRRASDLLAGDRKRALEFLEDQVAEVRQKAQLQLETLVTEFRFNPKRLLFEQEVYDAVVQAVPVFFNQALHFMEDYFGNYIADILAPHQQRADEFVTSVRQTAAEIFSIDYQLPEQANFFQMKRQPYWINDKWQTDASVIPRSWLEALLPETIRQARFRKRLEQHLDKLITHNVENLRWALLQNIETAFRTFSEVLNTRLTDAISTTNQAVETAILMKSNQVEIVEMELFRLRKMLEQVNQYVQRVENYSEYRSYFNTFSNK